jgi:hypothetical protein
MATVPKMILTFADPNGSLAVQGAAGPTITLQNGKVELELWRVDLPGPVAPQRIQNVVNGQTVQVEIPGQGLYLEASYVLLTKLLDSADLTARRGRTRSSSCPSVRTTSGSSCSRYKAGVLDDETSPLLDHADMIVQQATGIESKYIWQFDNEYRRTYNKTRPKGVYVFSGIDLTGTDADLYVSRELGNFDIDVYGSANTVPANSRFTVLTQQLAPALRAGRVPLGDSRTLRTRTYRRLFVLPGGSFARPPGSVPSCPGSTPWTSRTPTARGFTSPPRASRRTSRSSPRRAVRPRS